MSATDFVPVSLRVNPVNGSGMLFAPLRTLAQSGVFLAIPMLAQAAVAASNNAVCMISEPEYVMFCTPDEEGNFSLVIIHRNGSLMERNPAFFVVNSLLRLTKEGEDQPLPNLVAAVERFLTPDDINKMRAMLGDADDNNDGFAA